MMGSCSSDLARGAADWFLSEGRLEEAVEHRLAAGDHAGASDLLVTGSRSFMDRGAASTFLRLGEPQRPRFADPRLFVALAFAAGQSGRAERCAHWLEAAEPLIDADSEPLPGWRTLRAAADVLWATFRAAGDTEMAMRYATRAVDLEDEPTSYGHVVARQVLGGALMGAEDPSEGITMLQDCWRSPARHQLSVLLVLQMAGNLAMILIAAGDLDGANRVLGEVHELAVTAEHAWGQGAAAALAPVQLAKARLVMATDPGASVPEFQRAVDLAEDWGWATMVLLALVGLATAQWTVGDRPEARVNVAKGREVAAAGEARPDVVRLLEAFETRIGSGRRGDGSCQRRPGGGAHGP